ncbi:TPA: hypothetical protein ACSP7Z_005337, partial [Serratia fonticola]
MRVGVYIDTDTKNNDSGINNRLDASNAIELSRFATSDYASDNKSDVIYFSHLIAVRIVNTQRLKNKLPQALADFEKFRQLGVESAQLFNQAGVISSSLGNDKAAAEFYENAVKMDNNTIVYKS